MRERPLPGRVPAQGVPFQRTLSKNLPKQNVEEESFRASDRPESKAADIQVRRSIDQKNIVRSGFFPQIDAYATLDTSGNIYPSDNASARGEVGIQLIQRVWDFGATPAAYRASKDRVQVARDLQRSTRLNLALRIANVFLLVLRTRLNLDSADNYVKWHQQLAQVVRSYAERASPKDLLLIDSSLAQAQAAREEAKELVERSEIEYERLVGELPVA